MRSEQTRVGLRGVRVDINGISIVKRKMISSHSRLRVRDLVMMTGGNQIRGQTSSIYHCGSLDLPFLFSSVITISPLTATCCRLGRWERNKSTIAMLLREEEEGQRMNVASGQTALT